MDLHRRQSQFLRNLGILDLRGLVQALALDPLGHQRTRRDCRTAAVSLELGIFDDAVAVNLDLQAHYDMPAMLGMRLRWTIRVYNLLDRLNEYGVNSNTGRANQAIIRPSDRLGHWCDFATYEDRIYNPEAYSAPRLIKFGLGVVF